jgi:hypothetical protein
MADMICHKVYELLMSILNSFTIANQKSVRYSGSMFYFTSIAVQNVNKGFVYITDLTWSLIKGMY